MIAPLLIGWSQDTLSAVADFTTAFGSRGLSGGPAPEQIQNNNPLCDRLEDECRDVDRHRVDVDPDPDSNPTSRFDADAVHVNILKKSFF
jgi:hypothetical protein